LKPDRQSTKTALVPIMTGCNNFCSYCVVPYTRGRERSRPIKNILTEIRELAEKEYQKIILLGQNVNSYQAGGDSKLTFVDLLQRIEELPGKFEIEFLTSHPKDMGDDLIKAIATLSKLSHRVHLPIQSGDDQILKDMNRGYTVKEYLGLVQKLRARIPDLYLSTDFIVGFPGESREQFNNTIKLAEKVDFDKAYISQYSPRPGTVANRLNDILSAPEKKRRWLILDKIINR